MTFQDLYPGQRVRILSWDELNSIGYYDGIGIHLTDATFFHNKMKYLCGATLTIIDEPHYSDSDEDYLSPDIFQFDDPLLSFSYNIPLYIWFSRLAPLPRHARPSQRIPFRHSSRHLLRPTHYRR